jgi:hypothetical protein
MTDDAIDDWWAGALARFRKYARGVDLALFALLGIFLVGAGVAAALMALNTNVAACPAKTQASTSLGQELAILAVIGFLVGRGFGLYRGWVHLAPSVIKTGRREQKKLKLPWLLQAALTAFLVLVTVCLAYETVAVAGVDGLYPITSYVRCAAGSSPLVAALGTAALSILLGNWLWYPTAVRDSDPRRNPRISEARP